MNIVNYPHPALRVECRPVTEITPQIHAEATQMLELMYARDGLGLAAPQVALDYQMIVINFVGKQKEREAELVALNPVILESKGTEKDREGCLSFPGLYQDIRRAKWVKVQYYTLAGHLEEMECSDLAARIWQHEIDHLRGVLFIDKMGPAARLSSKKYIDDLVSDYERDQKKGIIPHELPMKL